MEIITSGCLKYPTKTGQIMTITIGNMHLEGSALIYIASDRNFFKLNKLEIALKNYDAGLDAVNDMLQGKLDIAVTTEYPLVGKAYKKEKIKSIASIVKADYEFLVARKDRGILDIADLKGKKIGLRRDTIPEFYLGRFLSIHSLNIKDVHIANMNISQSETALLDGEIDAIVDWQPYTDSILKRLGNNAVKWPVQSNQATYGLLVCRDDWIAKNSDAIDRFLKALSEAEKFSAENLSVVKSIVKKAMNFSDAYLDRVWEQNQFSVSIDQSLILAMEDEARWMIRNNLTTEKLIPNFLEYIHENNLEAIKPESVSIIR